MISFKCRNCGGELEIGSAGSLVCSFCGSRSFFSDSDFKGNEEFRKKLISCFRAKAIEKENDYGSDTLWECNGRAEYVTETGKSLTIDYMAKYDFSGCVCYVAKETIVYVFDKSTDASLFLSGIRKIEYPAADDKLQKCFPALKMNIGLKTGCALVFVRRPGFYPLEIFAPLPSVHLAWAISRMENFCCAFEYSGISHKGIDAASVFINPKTHEGMLFGDWRRVAEKTDDCDLKAIRNTAKSVAEDKNSPLQLGEFLNSKPKKTSYEDFEYWDTVIEKGFGGHKFIKM